MTKYKYNLIAESDSLSTDTEDFPRYLLGDTMESAEKTFACFEKYINYRAASYHSLTGIDKSEFFGDAVLALGKAKRDFDPQRSNNFVAYAKFLIIDAMNECIRNNIAIVKVPSYVYKSHKIIMRIQVLVEEHSLNIEDVLYNKDYAAPDLIKLKIDEDKEKLEKAAQRANLPYKELIKRAKHIPLVLTKEDDIRDLIPVNQRHEAVLAKIIVDTITPLMDEDEKSIAKMLMQDLPRSEICKRLGHSDDWVTARMTKIRDKITGKFLKGKNGKV